MKNADKQHETLTAVGRGALLLLLLSKGLSRVVVVAETLLFLFLSFFPRKRND